MENAGEKLRNWVKKMGYPSDKIPSTTEFESLCRGPMTHVWSEVIDRTKSRTDVRNIRMNLLLDALKNRREMEEHNTIHIPQLELYNKKRTLEKQLKDLSNSIADSEQLFNELSQKTKKKQLKRQKLKAEMDLKKKKILLLEEEIKSFKESLSEYENKTKEVKSLLPISDSVENTDKTHQALRQSFQKLSGKIRNSLPSSECFDVSKEPLHDKTILNFTSKNYNVPKPEKQNIICMINKDLASFDAQSMWKTILKFKFSDTQAMANLLNDAQEKKDHSENFVYLNEMGKVSSFYTKLKLEACKYKAESKKIEMHLDTIKEQLVNSDNERLIQEIDKIGKQTFLEKLKLEIIAIQKSDSNDIPNSLSSLDCVQDTIQKTKKSIEFKLRTLYGWESDIKKSQKDVENAVVNLNLFIGVQNMGVAIKHTTDFTKEISLFSDFPLNFINYNSDLFSIERLLVDNNSEHSLNSILHLINRPQQFIESTCVGIFATKLLFEKLRQLKYNENATQIEKIKNCAIKVSSSNNDSKNEILNKISVINQKCYEGTLTISELGQGIHFWINQPVQDIISKSVLFNGKTYFDYKEEYERLYNKKKNVK